MKESEFYINRECHTVYTETCQEVIIKYIAMHYAQDRIGEVFTAIQRQYVEYLSSFRTDLGGDKNFHNGIGGTYDCIMIFSYYAVMRDVTSFEEIEKICEEVVLPTFKKLGFVDINKKIYKRLMYYVFKGAENRCRKWPDYNMIVEPYSKTGPIKYKFTSCPVAEFAREHDLLDILPALCNVDYPSLEIMHARLVRTTTLGKGDCCDYTIFPDKDQHLMEHEEFRDENGGRWNR